MPDLSRYLTKQPAAPPTRDLSRYLTGGEDDEEQRFRRWYAERARRLGLSSDPDDPLHKYDYRAAFRAGAEPGPDGHWPSEFKADDHPNRFVNGEDTKTGRRLPPWEDPANRIVGALPHGAIEAATGMEFDDPRTLGDALRRVGTAAVGTPAGVVAAREMIARTLTPKPLEETVVGALGIPRERAALEAIERVTSLPVSQRSQDAAQARFINAGRSESPIADALADTAAMALGTMADPTNLIPTGTAVRGVRAAGRLAPLADEAAGLGAGGAARIGVMEPGLAGALPDPGSVVGAAPPGLGLTPPGSPRAVGPPIITKPFQTNIAAQVGGQEVADYIVQRSDEIAAAIGGPQTWDEVEEIATRLGTTKEDFLAREPRFALMSKEERARLTMVIKGNESDIASLQTKLADGGASDEDKYNLLRLIDQRGALIKLGVGVGSEYGRALNTLKMEARAALDESTLARQQLYRRYKDRIDQDAGMLGALAKLDPSNPDELQGFLRKVDIPQFREYVQEYWIGSVLSGPATQERNLIGNTMNAIAENLMVRPVRAMLDPVVAAAQGRQREHFLAEVPAAAVGMTHGVRKGVAKFFRIMRTGYDTDGPGKLLPVRSAFARSQNKVVREMVGPVATGSLRLLAAADGAFKVINHTAEIYAQAANIARKEGLQRAALVGRIQELADMPTGAMVKAADEFAFRATFNDDASEIGKAVMTLRDKVRIPLGRNKAGQAREIPLGSFIVPFVKIADRLMVRGFEYTPVGFAKAAFAAKGSAEVSDLAARGAIGSAVMLGAATLAMDDRLTAAAPADPAERDAFYRSGKKPWSVKMGDTWVPFGQLQPVSTPVAIVASAMQAWKDTGDAPAEEGLVDAAMQIGRYITDQSYMDSVAKFFEAVSGGGEQAKRAAVDLVTQTASGFVPLSGLTRSVAQAIDPRIIDARTIPQKMRAQIPVASKDVPARLDAWGEEITPSAGRLRGVLASGTPLDASKEVTNPLDAELARLGMPLGFVSNRMMDPVRRTTERLSQDEQYLYQQTAGRKSKEMLTALFADQAYQGAEVEAQRKAVENTIGAARQFARMQLLAKRHGWGR